MSIETNKALVRRLYEQAWGQGDLSVIDEIFAPEHILHWNELAPSEQRRTPAEVKGIVQEYRAAFPDLQVVVQDLVAEADKVVVQVTFTGTHLGVYAGFTPTHRSSRFTDMQILRIADGKIVESALPSGGLRYFFALLDGSLFDEAVI